MAAIEIDRALLPVLEETLAGCSNVEVVQGDVLKTDLRALCAQKFPGRPVYACANLPYYITTPAISALLDSGVFAGITVMVQKEVAERICAPAGTGNASAFSIYIQYHARAEYLFDVPRDCFVPQPKVDSAVIRLTPLAQPAVQVENEKLFFDLVRAAFNQRRKTLVNAIGVVFGGKFDKAQLTEMVTYCGLDARVRGERLSLDDYANLTGAACALMRRAWDAVSAGYMPSRSRTPMIISRSVSSAFPSDNRNQMTAIATSVSASSLAPPSRSAKS